jgi:hypothetical protein
MHSLFPFIFVGLGPGNVTENGGLRLTFLFSFSFTAWPKLIFVVPGREKENIKELKSELED